MTLPVIALILRRADKIADKAIEKAANEGKSGSEARKDASKARARFIFRAGGGGGGMFPDTERVPGKKQLKMKKGGMVKSSASKRADGIAIKGKTKGRMV
jgi:hypothetical protein